jgi:hypothetical protein
MGWRERDYARFTDDERRRFFGTATASVPMTRARIGIVRGAWAAVLVSAALFLVSQFPRDHPLLPALHFTIHIPWQTAEATAPRPVSHRVVPLRLPRALRGRSTLTIHAHLSGYGGRLATLEARWSRGSWRTVAVRRIPRAGAFALSVRLRRTGSLELRLSYPNGTVTQGRTVVR